MKTNLDFWKPLVSHFFRPSFPCLTAKRQKEKGERSVIEVYHFLISFRQDNTKGRRESHDYIVVKLSR